MPARALPLPLVRHLWLCVVVVHTVHTELPERRQEPNPSPLCRKPAPGRGGQGTQHRELSVRMPKAPYVGG